MTSDKTMVEEMARAIADVIWPLADWDGERAVAETAAGKAAQAAATIAQRRVEELEAALARHNCGKRVPVKCLCVECCDRVDARAALNESPSQHP